MLVWSFMSFRRTKMKCYSRSREDFRELLIAKYIPMKEAIFIEWIDCSKCVMIKPYAEKRAKENNYTFQVFRFDNENVKEFQIESVPMLVIREEWVVNQVLDMEGIVALVSNQK